MKQKILMISLFIGFVFGFAGCTKKENENNGNNNNEGGSCITNPDQEKCQPIIVYDVTDDDNIIYVGKNEEFKILQISDLHLSTNLSENYANGKPEVTYDFVKRLVSENKPDMVVLTGDNLYNYSSTTARNLRNLMDEIALPWTFVFGNHDASSLSMKKSIITEFRKSRYCVFQNEYENETLNRAGDHLIQLREETTKKLVYAFYMIDSGTYSNSLPTGGPGYESVYEDQLEQYKKTMASLNTRYAEQNDNKFDLVPHIIFQHICIPEYKTAFDLYKASDSSVKYLYGTRNENECPGKVNTNQFQYMKEAGAKAMFVGHDHINTYAVIYQDILLGYGGQAGYANIYDGNLTQAKNGVLITIDSAREISSKLVY